MMSDDSTPQPGAGLEGNVVAGPAGAGSKSERSAIWLDTPQRRLVLRRKDGPTYGDAALDAFVGKRVRCSGFVVGYTLLADRIEIVP
jgi:hypothetical protein